VRVRAIPTYRVYRLYDSIAMSLGNWFWMSRKGGTGEVGWYTQRVKKAWQCMDWLWKSLS